MNGQNPYQNTYAPGQYSQSPKKIHWRTYFVVLIIGLFAMAGILYLVNPQEREVSAAEGFSAIVVMASAIEEDFSYSAQPNNEYEQESVVYIYVDVTGITQKSSGAIDIVEGIEIKDPSGKSVFADKDFTSNKGVYEQGTNSISFSNTIPTTGWVIGSYTATITIKDNVSGKSIVKTVYFSITELSGEKISTTADLSTIISDAGSAQLIRIQKVTGPSGVIPELSFNQTVETDLSSVDLSNIEVEFTMPERYDAGRYVVEITYLNLANGQSKSVSKEINIVKGFGVSDFVFASSIDENYNYIAQPNNEYSQGSTIYVYMRAVDFEQKQVAEGYSVNVALDLHILDGSGITVASQERYLVINDVAPVKQDAYNTMSIFTADLDMGTYTLKAVFKDENSGKEAVREESFIIS